MARLSYFWAALSVSTLTALAKAFPQPNLLLPRGGSVTNVTTQTAKNGTASIMTSLLTFSGCNAGQKTDIEQAYIDALNILGTVGGTWGPQYMFLDTQVGVPNPILPWDYFGAKSKFTQPIKDRIINNYYKAQAPSSHWRLGDWWNDRYWDIACNDPGDKKGHKCGEGSGYEVEPSLRKDGGKYPLINFCPPFFRMETLGARVDHVNNGDFGYYKDDVRTMVSQGTAFLHEMMHTSATASGVSDPRCQDVTVNGYPGKAYGPSRAKQLARMELGGPEATSINVDNYVFYAVSWYMYTAFDTVPTKPKYSWPRLSADEHYPADENSLGDDASDKTIQNGALLNDQDFYAGSGFTPSGGNQPAGPTGPSTDTENIPMPSGTSAPPTSSPSSTPSAYAPGTCSFHLTETQTCGSDASNLWATIHLLDNNKGDLGSTPTDTSKPYGAAINVAAPYTFKSKLPNPLIITGEHQGDYVQFSYGGLQWTSKDTAGKATCKLGGWDPKSGPVCSNRAGDQVAVNQMDCSFPC